jgi:flagellar hook-associated protein FlgK
MLDSVRIGQTALRANATRLENVAHNIANSETPGYVSRQTSLFELPDGGVVAETVQQPATPPSGTLPSSLSALLPNDVSLETEMVNMTLSRHAFTAAIRAIQASEECTGTLLDIDNNQ